MGFSLINNEKLVEVMYMGITRYGLQTDVLGYTAVVFIFVSSFMQKFKISSCIVTNKTFIYTAGNEKIFKLHFVL